MNILMVFTTNTHFAKTAFLTHAIFALRPQAENISHYVLWLHNVENNIEENKTKRKSVSFLLH